MDLSHMPIEMLVRFTFNLVVAYIIIKLIYHRDHKGNDFVFTYFMFNSLIFFFAYILGNLDVNIAFGFGLFAVFAILRYRTDPIPIKEMTYLFIVITTGVINALSANNVAFSEVLLANAAIVVLTYFLERYWVNNLLNSKAIVYGELDKITPEKNQELIDELSEKTGLSLLRAKVGRINFKSNRVNIRVYYRD
ncbi:MAG: DUF4956 domain-containing protein [Candidatus Neomarinimicrobiota bacterium]